ncbi:putative ATP-dependent Clp protease proteolytic subunit-like [Hibiscus syriacus]|uniref:ATP-dependent Clp protease proteolytic subunit n=1 Tax=Hibiscus syriacus TaxID=106335 RepID=A0A6A2Y8K5_HIBSY|nr:putative ATP-dependent Clp protease proteolytic subunit-like [Hibiscus syriacus]
MEADYQVPGDAKIWVIVFDVHGSRELSVSTFFILNLVERSVSYNEQRPKSPPPDLPSLLLNGRIVYIGMPLVPAVTELVVAELMYLQWMDPKKPIYLYINSTGTTRDDGETVGLETEGFAIYDALMQLQNEVHTVVVGAAVGQACLLLSAGTKRLLSSNLVSRHQG